jgi:prevent-host-death family protein
MIDDMSAPTVRSHTRVRRVPARDLSRNTAKLLDSVLAGETVEVTRDGALVARLVPVSEADRALEDAVARGAVDPSVLDPARGDRLEETMAKLRAIRRVDPTNSASRALLAMREEEEDR